MRLGGKVKSAVLMDLNPVVFNGIFALVLHRFSLMNPVTTNRNKRLLSRVLISGRMVPDTRQGVQ